MQNTEVEKQFLSKVHNFHWRFLSLSRPFMRFLMLQAHVYSNSHSFGKHKFQVIDFTSRRVFCSRKCFYLTYLSLLLNVSFCFSVSSFAQSLFSVRFLVFVFVLDGYVMLAQKSLVRHVILFMNFLFFVLEHKQLMAITIVVVYPDVWLKNVSQAGIMMFQWMFNCELFKSDLTIFIENLFGLKSIKKERNFYVNSII